MPSRAELSLRARVVGVDPANYPNDSTLEQRVIYNEKLAATETGAAGVGTLTLTDVFSAAETILIGNSPDNKTYTFVAALTEAYGTATITSDATAPTTGDTVTIGDQVYTFRTTLSNPAVPNEVLIGASAAAALDNLKIAINASGGTPGTEYSVGTVAHPKVNATTNTNTTQVIQANQIGTGGNGIEVSENSTHLSWGAAATAGGVAPVENEVLIGASAAISLDNLKSAINGTAGAGVAYSTGTDAHKQVTATTNTDTTQVVQTIDFALGEDIATTETAANASWGATTLASAEGKVVAATAAALMGVSGGAAV